MFRIAVYVYFAVSYFLLIRMCEIIEIHCTDVLINRLYTIAVTLFLAVESRIVVSASSITVLTVIRLNG